MFIQFFKTLLSENLLNVSLELVITFAIMIVCITLEQLFNIMIMLCWLIISIERIGEETFHVINNINWQHPKYDICWIPIT